MSELMSVSEQCAGAVSCTGVLPPPVRAKQLQHPAPLGARLVATAWERMQGPLGQEENKQNTLLQEEKLHFSALHAVVYHIQRLNANVPGGGKNL